MAKPTLLVTRRYSPAIEARASRDYQAILNSGDEVYDAERLIAASTAVDALLMTISEPMTPELVAALPGSIKILANYGVGHEHIDLDAARKRGLVVTNTPSSVTAAAADLTMLLILAAARGAYQAQQLVRQDQWRNWGAASLLGRDIAGKNLGIVGMGRIGQAVARRAAAFGIKVHYHNRRRLAADLEHGATYHADPANMLAISDFLSLHCPATPQTRNWLNADRIAQLPEGAFVINTSRGTVIEEAALVTALQTGRLAGAGLDVFADEPNVRADLRALDNVFLLPHIGTATVETRDGMGFECLDNLDVFFAGGEPPARIA